MKKLTEIKPEFVDEIPKEKEHGVLYISHEYGVAIHLCACGCGGQAVTPIDQKSGGWSLVDDSGKTTLSPSIGNWTGEKSYHAHYFIRNNKIIWV